MGKRDIYLESKETTGYQGRLDFEDEFPVLGIPVRFRSNHPLVIQQAFTALGHWKRLSRDLQERASPLGVDIVIQETRDQSAPAGYDFNYQISGDDFQAHSGATTLRASRRTGAALAFATEALLQDEPAFQWFVIEALALFLVTASRRVPVHAAAVVLGGRSLAFAGASGAGKSSLAYAFLRRGFDLLSEDALYIGTAPEYRIWGNATKIHMLANASGLFPELEGRKAQLRPNGKVKITLPVSEIGQCRPALYTDAITLCLLEPKHGERDSVLERIPPDVVRKALFSSLEPGFDLSREQLPAVLDYLLRGQNYRLSVGYDINAIVDLVLDHLQFTRLLET